MKLPLLSLLFLSHLAIGSGAINLGPIGTHYEIFRFEKSENPQNILVVYTRLDDHCQFLLASENPASPEFGFYWLMDKKAYKPVHPLIRDGISERLKVVIPPNFSKSRDSFSVRVTDLNQVDPTLQNALVKVSADKQVNACQVKATFDAVKLKKIYAESEKTLLPPFRKVTSLRFYGVNEKTGESEQKIFQEKK